MNLIPHNEDLERDFLGGLLLNQNEYTDIQDLFHEELFYNKQHKIIARGFKVLKNESKPVDISLMNSWVNKQGLSKQCEPSYISSLTNKGILFGFMEKVLILNELWIRRNLILKSQQVINSAAEDTCDVFELIADQEKNTSDIINKISVGRTSDALDCHQELLNHLDALCKLKDGELVGVDTGFVKLNDLTAGWQKTDLIILAGRPGMGKTSLILNCVHASLKKTPTLVFSLEMSKMQLYARMCSQLTSIPLYKFLRVKMDDLERAMFYKESYALSNSNLFIEDKGGMDLNYIKMKARKLVRDKGIGLIIIDYLQLISRIKTNKSTNDEISEISGALKGLAKELNVPVIALSQLTRAVESTPDKRPSLVHLRDGGSIEQDADMVMFIYRPEYYEILDDGHGNSTIGKAQLIIAKQRNGALEDIQIGFDGKCTNFYNVLY